MMTTASPKERSSMARLRSVLDSRLSSRSRMRLLLWSCSDSSLPSNHRYPRWLLPAVPWFFIPSTDPCSVSEPLSRPRSVPDSYRRRRGRHAAMTVSTGIRKAPWHVFLSAASHHQRPRLKYLGLLRLHPGPKADESASDTPWSPTPTPAREWRRHGGARRGRKPKKKKDLASLRVTCIRIERSTMGTVFVWWSGPSVVVFVVVIQVQLDR